MTIQIDGNNTIGHYFVRDMVSTFMHGNGLAGGVFGLDGTYELNPGILPLTTKGVPIIPGFDNDEDGKLDHLMRNYATGALPGFNTPDNVTFGKTNNAHPFDQGKKLVHCGFGMLCKSSGPTIWVVHGPSSFSIYQPQIWLGNHGIIIMDHSDGLELGDFTVANTVSNKDGTHTSEIRSFNLRGFSKNPFIKEQNITVVLSDDKRSINFKPQLLVWDGQSPHNELLKWVLSKVSTEETATYPVSNLFGHPDFPIIY